MIKIEKLIKRSLDEPTIKRINDELLQPKTNEETLQILTSEMDAKTSELILESIFEDLNQDKLDNMAD